MEIFLDGNDSGWHMAVERLNIRQSLQRLGIQEAQSWYKADIVHNIWWNSFLHPKKFPLRFKKHILVTASNFVNLDDDAYVLQKQFQKVRKLASAWIVPSTKQKAIFDAHGLWAYYQPFYLDLSLFKPPDATVRREALLEKFQIPLERIKNKVIIGSFQRDSLGSDLYKPKWQKGPELLIELLKELPRDTFLLLLAGPRRHYVIRECQKYDIPYYYVGQETTEDDIYVNSLSIDDMPVLYYLTDIYLVTSASEGGPKAILEATAMKTFIFSTDVGLASDFLEEDNVFDRKEDYKRALSKLVKNFAHSDERMQQQIRQQHLRSMGTLCYEAMDKRLSAIYSDLLATIP